MSKKQTSNHPRASAHELLWAPWRMEFIRSIEDSGCFLCRAVQEDRDEENLVVARGESCFCILNRYPYNNGHLLVAPNRHRGTLNQLSTKEMQEIMLMIRQAQKALSDVVHPHGFNMGANLGRCAGAGLPGHFHMHLVPRWNGDTNFMPVLANTKVIPQSLSELHAMLAERMQELATRNTRSRR